MSHFFKKTLKISEDIINLHLCTKNFDMIYSFWDKRAWRTENGLTDCFTP